MVTNERRRRTASERDLNRTFGALADPIRRSIVSRLAVVEATVGELARPFRVSRPAISKHLRVLERAGLVRRERQGRVSRCEFAGGAMGHAAEWIGRYRAFWTARLEALAQYAEQSPPPRRKEPQG